MERTSIMKLVGKKIKKVDDRFASGPMFRIIFTDGTWIDVKADQVFDEYGNRFEEAV